MGKAVQDLNARRELLRRERKRRIATCWVLAGLGLAWMVLAAAAFFVVARGMLTMAAWW